MAAFIEHLWWPFALVTLTSATPGGGFSDLLLAEGGGGQEGGGGLMGSLRSI